TAYLEIFESYTTHLTNYEVVAEYIDGGILRDKPNANRLQLTGDIVCKQVMNRSIAAVIYAPLLQRETHAEYLSRVSSIAYALGFYSIPTIGVMVREAEFSKKKIYPTFVRPTPAYADESYVFLNLLQRLDYRQVQSYFNLEINDSLNASLVAHFEEVTSNIVVLYATKPHAYLIFAAASELSANGKVWMVNEDASKASNVPDGTAICATSTSKITYNDLCERISVDYDIINYNEGYREVGALHGSSLRLTEQTIHWAGGGAKPLEISLPKHLRAVTTNDPPFVYTTPIISLAECKNLGTVAIELSKANVVNVDGPWYPCPKYGQNYTSHHCCAGYAIDLLSNLSLPEPNTTIDTSFTFSLHLNDSYGAVILGEKGYILTGALGELDSDQADLAIGGMTINPERERYIDFSEPWSYHGIRILEKSIPRDSPMHCAARVLGIVWCGFCMIMVASYTANLAAFLVLDQPEKGLTGITDPRLRNPSANFSFGTVLNSNVYQYFKRHVELSTMFRKMEAHNVEKVSDALSSLING
ncbi:hypothetical protein GCK32_011215, partial [Trichostrongylus colubriformis]